MKFLLLDHSETDRKALELMIARCLDPPPNHPPEFYGYEQRDVFETPLPRDIDAVFFTVNTMLDAEAARQFNRVYEGIPMVAVSDSEEYSIEFYRFNAKYFLVRPIPEDELREALRRCKL